MAMCANFWKFDFSTTFIWTTCIKNSIVEANNLQAKVLLIQYTCSIVTSYQLFKICNAMVIFWCPTKSLYKIILDVYRMEYKFVSTSCWMFALFPKNLKRHISKCPVTTSYRVPKNEIAHNKFTQGLQKCNLHHEQSLMWLFDAKTTVFGLFENFSFLSLGFFFTLYIIKRTLLLYNVEQFVGPNI